MSVKLSSAVVRYSTLLTIVLAFAIFHDTYESVYALSRLFYTCVYCGCMLIILQYVEEQYDIGDADE
jgi:hypothetical protein